jgi:predicted dehydrogenase
MAREVKKVRYAVIGQGYIAQAAVLPAFEHAENAQLVALFSNDSEKRRELGKKYDVEHVYGYDDYDKVLRRGLCDAVYIALPNSMHRDYTERAARAGVHVLCEKPMAVTEEECEAMLRAAKEHRCKLMIAYRLHFEEANLRAIELIRQGKIGAPRIFASLFTMQVKEGDIRLQRALGGGPLYDIGIYCINAARYLFAAEPIEVTAFSARRGPRFTEVEETVSAVLRFPEDRLASFACSFGASEVSSYRVIGERGDLRVEPAYELADSLVHYVTIDGKTEETTFKKRDQFAPELVYFSRCILEDREPEPSGFEGFLDVRIIRALLRSLETGQPVPLSPYYKPRRPDMSQELHRPAVSKPRLVNASPPSRA